MKKILVIAAHPDDEVLGCGGIMAKLIQEGEKVFTLILGEGITSRFDKREEGLKSQDLEKLKISIHKVAEAIGVEKTFIFDFPDNRFDTVPLLEIVKVIEKVKSEIKPEVVFTHHRGDLNIDHRIVYKAVLTACRPRQEESVKEIYSFESPSSTDWNYPYVFNPNFFIDITDTIDKKIEALRCYETELREFPHPRSEEATRSIAKRWGYVAGLGCAEAFEVVRIIKNDGM